MKNLTVLTIAFTIPLMVNNLALAKPVSVVPDRNSATITFDPGFTAAGAPTTIGPFETGAGFPNLQLPLTTFTSVDGATSSAVGGISNLIKPNVFGLTFPTGTGVSQTVPDGISGISPAVLKIAFDVDFQLDAEGFGPLVFEYAFFPIKSVVDGAGSFTNFHVEAEFTNSVLGIMPPGINVPTTNCGDVSHNTVGIYYDNLLCLFPTYTLPGNSQTNIKGYIEFQAFDPNGAASVELVSASGFIPPSEIPIPGTLLLFSIGLTILMAKKRA
jgi:hypothetical protein